MNMIDGITGLIAGTAATAFATVALDGSTVSVEMVAKIAVPVGGMVWWLSSKFTRIDDHQTAINNRLDSVVTRLDRIETTLKNCPAGKLSECS